MNFLLFIIPLIFSFIFFVFYKLSLGESLFSQNQGVLGNFSSISGNIFIESIIFLCIGLFLFFYFSSFNFLNKLKASGKEKNKVNTTLRSINLSKIFKKYIYYIGFLLFYFSIYLILKSFGVSDFGYFILFLNIIIGILFFISHKAELFRDFIKINTILFSLYYIFIVLFSFVFGDTPLLVLDIVNTFFIFSFFIITFYSDSRGVIKPVSDSPLVLYFFLYSFVMFSFYGKKILGLYNVDFIQILIYIGLIFNIFIYFFLQKVTFFQSSKILLRVLSILFLYISLSFGMFLLIKNFTNLLFQHYIIFGILAYGITFNYLIHNRFQNYISYFFSFSTTVFIIYFLLVKYTIYSGGNLLKGEIVLTFTLSFFLVIVTYMYKQKYIFDYYFLHICAYLVNFLGISYYLFQGGFDILNIGIILLLFSIFIFLSYFRLKRLKNI